MTSSGAHAGPVSEAELWPMVRMFHLTVADLAHALRYSPEGRWVARCALPLAGGCALGGFIAGYFGWSTGLLHLLALYLVGERLLPTLRGTEQAKASCGPEHTHRLSFTEEHLVVSNNLAGLVYSEENTTTYVWEQLAGYYACPDCLVLVTPIGSRQIIPKTWFSALEYAALHGLLKRKVRPLKGRWWPLLRPLVVSILLLSTWLLWEVPL